MLSSINKDFIIIIIIIITAKLICVFVFAYAKCWFSHDAAHIANVLLVNFLVKRVAKFGVVLFS